MKLAVTISKSQEIACFVQPKTIPIAISWYSFFLMCFRHLHLSAAQHWEKFPTYIKRNTAKSRRWAVLVHFQPHLSCLPSSGSLGPLHPRPSRQPTETHTHINKERSGHHSEVPLHAGQNIAGLYQRHGSSESLLVAAFTLDLLTFFQGDQWEASVTHSFDGELTSLSLEELKSSWEEREEPVIDSVY